MGCVDGELSSMDKGGDGGMGMRGREWGWWSSWRRG